MSIRAYRTIAKTALVEAVTYRASLIEWMIFNVFDMAPFMLIWMVTIGNRTVAGYDQAAIFTYYLLAFFFYTYIYSHGWWDIIEDIRNGRLSAHLVRPIPYLRALAVRKLASKLLDDGLALLIVVPIALIFRNLIVIPQHAAQVGVTFLAATLAIFLFISLSRLMAMTAFWLDDAQGIMALFWATDAVLSGSVAPLALLPMWLQNIAHGSPFRFLISFPIECYLGHLSTQQIALGFVQLLSWMLFLHLASRLVWARGVRRYSAVGM